MSHTLVSSYTNKSALDLPSDHPFRAALPPGLRISADGDIVSALATARKHRHRRTAVVNGEPVPSPLDSDFAAAELRELHRTTATSPTASVRSTSSAGSRLSVASTMSIDSTSSSLSCLTDSSCASSPSGSTSKLVQTLGSEVFHSFFNAAEETENGILSTCDFLPRLNVMSIFTRKPRTSTS